MKIDTQEKRLALLLGVVMGVVLTILIRLWIFLIFEIDHNPSAPAINEPVVRQHYELIVYDWRIAE